MRWRKLGLIYQPTSCPPWFSYGAITPTPIPSDDTTISFIVTRCDRNGVGRPASVTLDLKDPFDVRVVEDQSPLLDVGRAGMFDDNGVMACSVVSLPSGDQVMYYVGFELCARIRYRLFTGAAVRTRGQGEFFRVSPTPLLDRLPGEAFFRGGPCVLREGDVYRMWYVAGDTWTTIANKQCPVYELRYLESRDPLCWSGNGRICMKLGNEEHGIGRPWVVRAVDRYQLFFSRRSLAHGGEYRLGYAESNDGISWRRMDEDLNLDVSDSGWDSKAIMYAVVTRINEQTWCFYNGNDFGREGFGAAIMDEP